MTAVAPPLAFYRGPWSGVKREGLGLGSLACELPPWGIGTSTFTILATSVILSSWSMFFIGIIGWGCICHEQRFGVLRLYFRCHSNENLSLAIHMWFFVKG